MTVITDLVARHPGATLKINLGCGSKRIDGFVGVDIGPGADVTMDVASFLQALPDGCVAEIYSRHFLEHVEPGALLPLLRQMDRVLKPGGTLKLIVPHFSNPYFYSDPTHRQPFGMHTFSYLCQTSSLRRQVPSYAAIPGWALRRARLGFLPYGRLRLLGMKLPMLSDLLNAVVAPSQFASELFERYLCWVLPIYEITFEIGKPGSVAKETP